MEKEILFSIILPVYNVIKHLNRCIESIVTQNYHNFEIIIVDDGSTDGSSELCDEWSLKDKRIRVVHKKNEGLGLARNTGLDYIHGKYVWFIDSDDYISNNSIESIVNQFEKNCCDIVLFGLNDVDNNGKIVGSICPKFPKVYTGDDITSIMLPDLISSLPKCEKGMWMSAWACAISVTLIKKSNWRFVSERKIISEDIYSLLSLYKNVNKVCVLDKKLYNYCYNETSLTHAYRKDRFKKVNQFYLESIKLCEKLGYSDVVKSRLFYPYISNVIGSIKIISRSDMKWSNKKIYLNELLNDKILSGLLNSYDMRYEKKKRRFFLLLMKKKIVLLVYLLSK